MPDPQQTGPAAGWTWVDEPPANDSAPSTQETKGGLTMAAISKLTPAAAWEAMRFGTSPTVPKTAAQVGRIVGGLAPVVGGGAAAGVPGAAIGLAGASKGAWAGGRTGWFSGKLAQDMARPVASLLDKAAPIAKAVGKVGGVQGALDLAQIVEPERKDIGFLGLGASMSDLDILKANVAKGANPASTAAALAKGDPKKFGALLTAYMQSRQVK